jgi:hypothetical protein
MSHKTVAVLFARADSIYKSIPACDVVHIARDARIYPGGLPIIAHPPCRAWGGLRAFANPRPDEKGLALYAVELLRLWGGVLEHPRSSTLWPVAQLPEPGDRDAWGGFTIEVHQHWFGHRAEKATRLYIVGCEPEDLPPIPVCTTRPTHVVANSRNLQGTADARPEITKKEREATPPAFAQWLIDTATLCKGGLYGQ